MHISTLLSGYPQTIYSENTSHLDTQLQKAERQSPHACEQEMEERLRVCLLAVKRKLQCPSAILRIWEVPLLPVELVAAHEILARKPNFLLSLTNKRGKGLNRSPLNPFSQI